MKKAFFALVFGISFLISNSQIYIPLIKKTGAFTDQRGYYDAPYIRYEAENAILLNGSVATAKSYSQADLQSEASDQICVDLRSTEASAEFSFTQPANGLVIRFSVPDGESAVVGVYHDETKVTSLTLNSKWSWEYLWNNGDPNNTGIKNQNARMRFDEVRYLLPEKISNLKLVKESGNLWIDFIELEPVPAEITTPADAAIYSGDGSTLQAFIDANGGKTIFIPAGIYSVNSQLYLGVPKTKLQGAGMWYTQLNFTVTDESNGGLRANAHSVSYSDLFITSEMTSRTNGYAGIHGVYTQGSTISNVWVEHCATGAWIAQYVQSGPAYADGFIMSGCRFRNTYADGINLCKGTRNAVVEHCNFRNNGDDGMAIWSAEGLECINNTYRYNTVENTWRAAGIALYGGKDNKFYNIIVRDNLEVGITINNLFQGVGFNDNGMHDFHDITLSGCGTFNDIYNARAGAINITGASSAGTKVQNIRLSNININDSKCDAIRFVKNSGSGIFNITFENISIDGTGMEYPYNNIDNSTAERGFAVIFEQYPYGKSSYCKLNYSNLGGNAGSVAFNTAQIGNYKWEELTECNPVPVSSIELSPADTSLAGGAILQLLPVYTPADASNKTHDFISSNPAIATVNSAGLVKTLSSGQVTISIVTQDGNFTASCLITVTSDPLICYKIKNRWQNTYLYDGGDRVKYSTTASGNSYLWIMENKEGNTGFKNLSTGEYMHIENLLGYVECSATSPGTLSSMWSVEDAGSGFVRIRNESDTSFYIHNENLLSHAQYGTIEAVWWSAMWLLEEQSLVSSIKNLSVNDNTRLYPNPSSGEFTITVNGLEGGENVSIKVISLTGQLVYSFSGRADSKGQLKQNVNSSAILSTGNYNVIVAGTKKLARTRLLICR